MNPNLPNSTRPDEFPVLLKPSLDAMKVALDAADVDPRRTVRHRNASFSDCQNRKTDFFFFNLKTAFSGRQRS